MTTASRRQLEDTISKAIDGSSTAWIIDVLSMTLGREVILTDGLVGGYFDNGKEVFLFVDEGEAFITFA